MLNDTEFITVLETVVYGHYRNFALVSKSTDVEQREQYRCLVDHDTRLFIQLFHQMVDVSEHDTQVIKTFFGSLEFIVKSFD